MWTALAIILVAITPAFAQNAPRDPAAHRVDGIVAAAYDAVLAMPLVDGGILAEVTVAEGDRVEAGQSLATFDDALARLRMTQAQLAAESDGALELARLQLDVVKARNQGDQSAVRAAEVEVEMQTLAHRQAQLALELVQAHLAQHTLTAPVAGVVERVYAAPGEFLMPGQPVVRLVRPSPVTIEAAIPSDLATGLSVGDTVTVHPPNAPPTVSFAFTGRISHLASTLDPHTDARFARITLAIPESSKPDPKTPETSRDDADAPTLLPGARVTITLHTDAP